MGILKLNNVPYMSPTQLFIFEVSIEFLETQEFISRDSTFIFGSCFGH